MNIWLQGTDSSYSNYLKLKEQCAQLYRSSLFYFAFTQHLHYKVESSRKFSGHTDIINLFGYLNLPIVRIIFAKVLFQGPHAVQTCNSESTCVAAL